MPCDVWEGVLYSVVRLQGFNDATLQFAVLNPELNQKLDFIAFQLIIAQFISYNSTNCTVNKHQVS